MNVILAPVIKEGKVVSFWDMKEGKSLTIEEGKKHPNFESWMLDRVSIINHAKEEYNG